ncbi:RbsD/FucU domain-containing protein [uncultured Tateyamaria sp.]|nr:RbsD/FucU domain-containing protein [uncultured Tateyamaria sp.]
MPTLSCFLGTHEKDRSASAVAVVRTGESTPYANVGSVAGVTF